MTGEKDIKPKGDAEEVVPPKGEEGASKWLLPFAGVLFFISGALSLIYEVAWVKILSLEFGSSAWSATIVVSSFMAGLGAGSFWGGKRAEKFIRPIRFYAWLEVGVAVFGILSIPLLSSLDGVLGPLYRLFEGQFLLFLIFRFILAFGVLFIPTFLMGASLPILVVGLAGDKKFQEKVGLFYGINTLGAAFGVFFAGFYALPNYGITGTVSFSVVGGLGVAGAAFLLHHLSSGSRSIAVNPQAEGPKITIKPPMVLTLAVFIAGTLGTFYQISWTRLLVPIVGSSTYAFTIILGVFLIGIGVGGALSSIPLLRRIGSTTLVAIFLGLTSLSVLVGMFGFNDLPDRFSELATGLGDQVGKLFVAQGWVVARLIFFPTLFMGAALPLAISAWKDQTEKKGEAIGSMYGANTLGAILGSMLAGFVFLPWVGPQASILYATIAGVVVAWALFFFGNPVKPGKGQVAIVLILGSLVIGTALKVPDTDVEKLYNTVFRSVMSQDEAYAVRRGDMIYSEVGTTSTVTVHRTPESTVLKVNGKPDATTSGDMATQFLVAHLPMFLHAMPKEVCVIGFGSGATAYAATTHPEVRKVDVVEIESAVLNTAPYFKSVNRNVLEDPRVRAHIEDGRTFLRYREDTYDVIISEPSNPWIAGETWEGEPPKTE